MIKRTPIEKTASGLIAVHEIPAILLQNSIISFLRTKAGQTYKADSLATAVFRHANFAYRGKNKEKLLGRILENVDEMLNNGILSQYETKTMVKIKLS